jgi:pimeloyl-ACP methyl ester carboxylesterase
VNDQSLASDLTVLLVHGAFADGSTWGPVIQRLQAAGVVVRALATPMRSLAGDAAYVASVIAQTQGRILLAAHSYGGAVITNAAAGASNVAGLVYVAAFAPDQGETLMDITAASKDAILGPALVQAQYPTDPGGTTAVELFVDPASFPAIFAADLPAATAAVLAAGQRPIAAAAFAEATGPAAWKSIPVWAVVANQDKAAGADIVLAEAKRANADMVQVDSSHLVMLSKPDVVANQILKAAKVLS